MTPATRARALTIATLVTAQAYTTLVPWSQGLWAAAAVVSAVVLERVLPGRPAKGTAGDERSRHVGPLGTGLTLGRPREGLAVTLRAVLWAVPILVIMVAGAVISIRLGSTGESELDGLPRSFDTLDRVAPFLWYAVVVAPVVEEVVWRGLVQRQLDRALGPWPAIALSGLLFWAMHWVAWGGVTPINQLLGGWVIAWSWHRTNGGLVAPILLHAVGNLAIAGGTALWIERPAWLRALLGFE